MIYEQTEREADRKRVRPVRKILQVLGNLLFVLVCLGLVSGAALFAFSQNPEKSFFGYRFYNVLSNSMTPQAGSLPGGFVAGDLIIVEMARPEEIAVGDIIIFVPGRDAAAHLTHRVVDIEQTGDGDYGFSYITKGDANLSNDPPVAAERLIGKKVAAIPKLGIVIQFVRENVILTLVFVAAAFGLVFTLRWFFAKPAKQHAEYPGRRVPSRSKIVYTKNQP